jgi:uncharacterized protein (DUF302 family)
MPKTKKLKKLKINMRFQFEGQEGMDEFARLLRVLSSYGYSTVVNDLIKELIAKAKQRGLAVPHDLEVFANAEVQGVH